MCSPKLANDIELLITVSLCFVCCQGCMLLWSVFWGEGETPNCIPKKEINSMKAKSCVKMIAVNLSNKPAQWFETQHLR